MSRPPLSINRVEDRTVNELSGKIQRERNGLPKPKTPHKTGPEVVRLNGRRYVEAPDTAPAEALFASIGKGRR